MGMSDQLCRQIVHVSMHERKKTEASEQYKRALGGLQDRD